MIGRKKKQKQKTHVGQNFCDLQIKPSKTGINRSGFYDSMIHVQTARLSIRLS